eukprot:2118031-Pleurochrysis_carterae.AAC.3
MVVVLKLSHGRPFTFFHAIRRLLYSEELKSVSPEQLHKSSQYMLSAAFFPLAFERKARTLVG